MFSDLTEKLNDIFKVIKSKGVITEKDLDNALREIKFALLEADVNYKVVKDFTKELKEELKGKELEKSLTPGQIVVEEVHKKLTEILGGQAQPLTITKTPFIIMLVGLQGSGKTTTAAKLAKFLRSKGRQPLLVACDIYRPAAIKQLQILGKQINIDVFSKENSKPEDIAKEALNYAKQNGKNVIIIDTAGRLHIDDELMEELERIKQKIEPDEILFVADAMIGQEAVNVAKVFDERVGITGAIFTKLDGDARGGAALSIMKVVGKPIKFAGVGEKISDFEPFYPDRVASRILGMGDVLTLIEKVRETENEKEAKELARKLKKQQFSLDDFLNQLKKIQKMGSIAKIIQMIPGMNKVKIDDEESFNKEIKHIEAIILSMTKEERQNYKILNASRKRRIAKGSGTRVSDVNRLIKQFIEMNKMMKGMNKSKAFNLMKRLGIKM
ncbi:signal recognition particle protein [Hippea maritima]|uniref:Signal recognition particle protein n=1 Tax=Hippea maritima (strain ATCC 700847 / DSM 10411 / MH2) TaxID=760142 RepID=F2LY88_HIPMA|nr:signal recognition particle protein [Hippea maritima]AEA34411.1 signal recognition particle protein [Hippea maritima DSM 10411]